MVPVSRTDYYGEQGVCGFLLGQETATKALGCAAPCRLLDPMSLDHDGHKADRV